MSAPPRTVLEVVRLSTRYLEQHGVQSSRLDAELIVAHGLGLRRIDLYLQHDRPLSDAELGLTRDLLRRRGGGEPVAYVTGTREFFGRAFRVTPEVLIPRPETETLVEHAIVAARARPAPLRIADLGTGSGCIAVTLALELDAVEVHATDFSPGALEVARGNAERLGAGGRVLFHEGSWSDPLPSDVDILVSNPPYVTTGELAAAQREVRDHEPRLALEAGGDGMGAYRELVEAAPRRLASGATMLLEVDPRRAADVMQLVRRTLRPRSISAHRDLSGHDRVVEAILP